MIIIYCDNDECPYNDENGTCGKRVVYLDENGKCDEDE